MMNDPTDIIQETSSISTKTKYLLFLRNEFRDNEEILGILNQKTDSYLNLRDQVMDYYKDRISESRDVLEEALEVILAEFDSLKINKYGNYLVDSSTGLPIKIIEPGDIIEGVPYLDDEGKLHKSPPKIHPKIAVSLIMQKVEVYRNEKLNEKISKPEYRLTFAHVNNTRGILDRAIELLKSRGISIEETNENHERIIFGKEHVEAEDQSINPNFHRMNNHSSVLAIKVMKLISQNKNCWLANIEKFSNSNYKWYTVDLFFKKIHRLN